jgi:hypothetical protein
MRECTGAWTPSSGVVCCCEVAALGSVPPSEVLAVAVADDCDGLLAEASGVVDAVPLSLHDDVTDGDDVAEPVPKPGALAVLDVPAPAPDPCVVATDPHAARDAAASTPAVARRISRTDRG